MRIIFETNSRIDEIISEFQKEGYKTGSEIVRMALIYTFENKFKKKLEVLQAKNSKGSNICDQLKGTIKGNTCTYTIYEKQNPKYVESFSAEVPLASLTIKHLEDQYKPSREECEEVAH